MAIFAVFIISLVLLVLLFIMKGLEIYHGKKIFLEDMFDRFDAIISRFLRQVGFWWSQVNFKNTKLVFSVIVTGIKGSIVAVKRRFDHKQSSFFIKREYHASKKKGSVSFFLKDVSEYKKSLREGKEDKQ